MYHFIRPAFLLFILSICTSAPNAVLAQAFGLPLGDSQNKEPIAISAKNGIQRDDIKKIFTAKGEAQASQGDFVVIADTLKAFYKVENEKTVITRMEAIGKMYAKSATDEVFADKGVYEVEKELLTLTGKELLILSPEGQLRASEKIVYNQKENKARAEGNALVVQGQNQVSADKVYATLDPNQKANSSKDKTKRQPNVIYAKAVGNVVIFSPDGIIQCDTAEYDLRTEKATCKGNVKVTQGPNQMVGEIAKVNMKTGYIDIQGGPDGRTYIVIDPDSKEVKSLNQ